MYAQCAVGEHLFRTFLLYQQSGGEDLSKLHLRKQSTYIRNSGSLVLTPADAHAYTVVFSPNYRFRLNLDATPVKKESIGGDSQSPLSKLPVPNPPFESSRDMYEVHVKTEEDETLNPVKPKRQLKHNQLTSEEKIKQVLLLKERFLNNAELRSARLNFSDQSLLNVKALKLINVFVLFCFILSVRTIVCCIKV